MSCLFVWCRKRPSDPVLPVWREAQRLLHPWVCCQLHRQRAGYVPEGGTGQAWWWVSCDVMFLSGIMAHCKGREFLFALSFLKMSRVQVRAHANIYPDIMIIKKQKKSTVNLSKCNFVYHSNEQQLLLK